VKKRPTQQYASPSSEYKILAKTGKKDSDWPKTESEIFAHVARAAVLIFILLPFCKSKIKPLRSSILIWK
jgi:hypothetical protein